jgi:hypothetical protein
MAEVVLAIEHLHKQDIIHRYVVDFFSSHFRLIEFLFLFLKRFETRKYLT